MSLDKPESVNAFPLKILSFGAGAIGTYIGGSLALSGQKVVFLEHPAVAQQLIQEGMKLEIEGETRLIHEPLVVDTLESALQQGDFDLALFALKSFDTQAAMQSMAPYLTRLPPFLCLQNGVENEGLLANYLGKERVIAGTVTSAISKPGIGHIILERKRGCGVASGHPLSIKIVQAMNQAGLNASLFKNAEDMKWSKMLTNLLANASSAILDMSPAEIFSNPDLFRLELAQLRETLWVMHKLGINPVDIPGVPVRLLAFVVEQLPAWLSRPLLQKVVGKGRGQKMPSFHIDLHSGRGKSEVNYLNGAVVRQSENLGIPTPANRLLNDTLLDLLEKRIAPGNFSRKPQALLEKFQQ